jgi:hypothetical protein
MPIKKKSKKTRHMADKERYMALKEYVYGKIGEMRDCKKCNLTEHQSNHLQDIEDYINQLDADNVIIA